MGNQALRKHGEGSLRILAFSTLFGLRSSLIALALIGRVLLGLALLGLGHFR
jgi:hypothetical protein